MFKRNKSNRNMRFDRQKGRIISKCEKITVTNEFCVFNQIKMKNLLYSN